MVLSPLVLAVSVHRCPQGILTAGRVPGPCPNLPCPEGPHSLAPSQEGTYRLQLPQEGVLQCPLAGRLGHMQVQAVPPAHSVQAQDEGHVVLEQAGICVVQVVFQPALGALVVELAPSRGKEEKVVPGVGEVGYERRRRVTKTLTRRWSPHKH